MAVISAIKEWRSYLEGNLIVIVTDDERNIYLVTATNVHAIKRRARWLDILWGYNYTPCHRPGRINVADPISRVPQQFDALCASRFVAHMEGICRAHSVDCGTPGHGLTVESTVSGRLLSAAAAAICFFVCAQAVTRSVLHARDAVHGHAPRGNTCARVSAGRQLLRGGVRCPHCSQVYLRVKLQ
jgi:hypothetical protein